MLLEKLQKIQYEMKAPKNLYNSFGKYKYRNAESILEAFKPFGEKYKVSLVISDEILYIGERYYIKADVTLYDTESDSKVSNSALARESFDKKGMDDSQITGTASSYARKYALNGLFLLDDTKDADTDEYHEETTKKAEQKKVEPKKEEPKEEKRLASDIQIKEIAKLFDDTSLQAMLGYFKVSAVGDLTEDQASTAILKRRKTLGEE